MKYDFCSFLINNESELIYVQKILNAHGYNWDNDVYDKMKSYNIMYRHDKILTFQNLNDIQIIIYNSKLVKSPIYLNTDKKYIYFRHNYDDLQTGQTVYDKLPFRREKLKRILYV